jgi:hypothetical protein
MSTSIPEQIRAAISTPDDTVLHAEIQAQLDRDFSDLDVLLGHAGSSKGEGTKRGAQRRRRGLKEEILVWEEREAAADQEVSAS